MDLQPAVCTIQHPAAHLLNHLQCHSAPAVLSTSLWSQAQCEAAITRGSHLSARQHPPFLEQEMLHMVRKGQWIILPYHDIAHLPNLQISPMGVVPQQDQRPQTITNYTFSEVNANTVDLTSHLPLQFGRALLHILCKIVTSDPTFGPIFIIKLNLADGFYQIHLAPQHILALGVAFPTQPGKPLLIAFPLALPMGWTSSPLLFCTTTETVANLTNHTLRMNHPALPHCLELEANPSPPDAHMLPITLQHKHCPCTLTALLAHADPLHGLMFLLTTI